MAEELVDTGALDHIFNPQEVRRWGYTQTDLQILTRVLSRACARCGSDPGNYCVSPSGERIEGLDYQHIERRMIGVKVD